MNISHEHPYVEGSEAEVPYMAENYFEEHPCKADGVSSCTSLGPPKIRHRHAVEFLDVLLGGLGLRVIKSPDDIPV